MAQVVEAAVAKHAETVMHVKVHLAVDLRRVDIRKVLVLDRDRDPHPNLQTSLPN